MQLAEVSRIGFQSVASFCAVSVLFLFLFLLIGAFLCFGQDSGKVSSFSPIDRAKVTAMLRARSSCVQVKFSFDSPLLRDSAPT